MTVPLPYEWSMKVSLGALVAAVALAWSVSAAAQTAGTRPPVGVPVDAIQFNGKWYRVYLEKVVWKRAREKCTAVRGQLAIVPDEATQEFIVGLSKGLDLWLGATDEKVEGLWVWGDGTPMTFTAWGANEPNNGGGREHYLQMLKGAWNDARNDNATVGYICEWGMK